MCKIDWVTEFEKFLEREKILEKFTLCVREDRNCTLGELLEEFEKFELRPEWWVAGGFDWFAGRDYRVWSELDVTWEMYVKEKKGL